MPRPDDCVALLEPPSASSTVRLQRPCEVDLNLHRAPRWLTQSANGSMAPRLLIASHPDLFQTYRSRDGPPRRPLDKQRPFSWKKGRLLCALSCQASRFVLEELRCFGFPWGVVPDVLLSVPAKWPITQSWPSPWGKGVGSEEEALHLDFGSFGETRLLLRAASA
jgi:hypothetical protein